MMRVTFEGPQGCGKTILARKLLETRRGELGDWGGVAVTVGDDLDPRTGNSGFHTILVDGVVDESLEDFIPRLSAKGVLIVVKQR